MEKECVERRAFIQQCKNFGAACVYITYARSHLILCVKWPLVWHQQRRQLLLTVGSRPYNQTRAAEWKKKCIRIMREVDVPSVWITHWTIYVVFALYYCKGCLMILLPLTTAAVVRYIYDYYDSTIYSNSIFLLTRRLFSIMRSEHSQIGHIRLYAFYEHL